MLQIIYKYNDQEEAKTLTPIVEAKLSSLNKFIEDEAVALCEIEFEKVAPQQSGNIYRIEVNVTIDGKLHRAEATEASFEKALDEVRSELDKEMRRAKGKQASILKRAGRKLKDTLLRS